MQNKLILKCLIKVILCLIIALLVALFFMVFIPLIINWLYMQDKGYQTVWDGADVLAFYGAALSAFGTIVLGYFSYKQNQTLVKMDEERFITENSSLIFLSKVVASGWTRSTNEEEFTGQVLQSQKTQCDKSSENSTTLEFQFYAESTGNRPVLVQIKKLNMLATIKDKQILVVLDATNQYCDYSKVAIMEKTISFSCIVKMCRKEKYELIRYLMDKKCKVSVTVDFDLLTNKYVSSGWRCRSGRMVYQDAENPAIAQFGADESSESACFWRGSDKVERTKVMIREIKE